MASNKSETSPIAVIQPELGFRAWAGVPSSMQSAHVHSDVEWNWTLRGAARYFICGRYVTLEPGMLSIFWAGVPHQLVSVAKDTELAWLTLPLAAVLRWDLNMAFTTRLLAGNFLSFVSPPECFVNDMFQFDRWQRELPPNAPAPSRIALLEIEARLRRHVADVLGQRRRAERKSAPEDLAPLDRMAQFIGEQYQEELRIADIVAESGLHPNAAMRLFKRGSGMTIWEYLTRIRIAHAQRLLLTTDQSITRIALDSGFGSLGRFYAAFARICHKSPRRYRLALQARKSFGPQNENDI